MSRHRADIDNACAEPRCPTCGAGAARPALADRIALRPREAAAAIGVSERAFRDLLPEIPHVRRGNLVLIPVEQLRKWLTERALAEPRAVEAAVEEILEAVTGAR